MNQLIALWVLVGAALLLVALTAVTRSSPPAPAPDRADYFRRWSSLHGGYRAGDSPLAAGWLGLIYRCARPFASAGVSPTALTCWGVLVSAAVPVAAATGGRWPLLGVALVVLGGALDNLDGAVAVISGRTTRLGYVLDSLADRLSDAAYLLALLTLGAPGPLCAAAIGLTVLQEYARARAGNAGMGEIGVVTVWERPTRVILTAFLLLACGLQPSRADVLATAGAWATAAFGLVGSVQLLLAIRRSLAE